MALKTVPHIERSTLGFLADLEKNNDRDWFNAHKGRYMDAQENVRSFADALIVLMDRHDRIATASGKESLMRIFNDQRFHKDRPPYAPRFGGRLSRVKPELRGGYFFRIQPGGRSHVTCGFMGPEPADLKLIRMDIARDHATWEGLLNARAIRKNFGHMTGEQLLTAPKGFPKDPPAIDLLRRKQFLLRHAFSDVEVLSPDLLGSVDKIFRSVRPLFDHMTEVLTSDVNGNSVFQRRA